jgi:hypothetical protein
MLEPGNRLRLQGDDDVEPPPYSGPHPRGYTLEDAETVVKFKAREWPGTRWAAYLCPSTLFSEKFEGYLQAALKSNNGHDVNAAWKDEASGEVPLP